MLYYCRVQDECPIHGEEPSLVPGSACVVHCGLVASVTASTALPGGPAPQRREPCFGKEKLSNSASLVCWLDLLKLVSITPVFSVAYVV